MPLSPCFHMALLSHFLVFLTQRRWHGLPIVCSLTDGVSFLISPVMPPSSVSDWKPQAILPDQDSSFLQPIFMFPWLTALTVHPKGAAGWGPPTLANSSFLPSLASSSPVSNPAPVWVHTSDPGEGLLHTCCLDFACSTTTYSKGSMKNCQPEIQQSATLFFKVKENLTDSQINKNWDS